MASQTSRESWAQLMPGAVHAGSDEVADQGPAIFGGFCRQGHMIRVPVLAVPKIRPVL